MSLLDIRFNGKRAWGRVGDAYEITRKPRHLDCSSFEVIPFAPMKAMPKNGAYMPDFILKAYETINSGTYFEQGDILVAKIKTSFENGKQALITDIPIPFGYATTEIIPLHPRDSRHDRRFLFFYLFHPDIRQYIAGKVEGSTRPRIPEDILLGLPIPVFNHHEQTAISNTLEIIQKARAIETKYEQTTSKLKRSVMQALFTRGLHNEPQKETGIGSMPESWDVIPLEKLCTKTDMVDLRHEHERIIEYVDVSSVSRESLQIESTSRFILKEAPGRARKRILSGDVIFATVRPTLLRASIIPPHLHDQVCSTAFCVLRRDPKKADDKFIYYLIQRDQFIQQVAQIETGASYPAVTDRIVKEQPVPVPSMKEQKQIVHILETIDRKIDLHRKKQVVLDDLFKSLLHKLMIGEIQVSSTDLSVFIDESDTEVYKELRRDIFGS